MRFERWQIGTRQHRRFGLKTGESSSGRSKQRKSGECAARIEVQAAEGEERQAELRCGDTGAAGKAEGEAVEDEHGCTSAVRRLLDSVCQERWGDSSLGGLRGGREILRSGVLHLRYPCNQLLYLTNVPLLWSSSAADFMITSETGTMVDAALRGGFTGRTTATAYAC